MIIIKAKKLLSWATCFLFSSTVVIFQSGFAEARVPWRLEKEIGLPEWLSITGEHRIWYETLNRQFRANSSGSDQVLLFRTLVAAEIQFSDAFKIKAELQDARQSKADKGSLINNGIVNALELLEANIVWARNDLFAAGSESVLRVGRIAMDIVNRRFVVRNRWRNVIQAFTGIDWKWTAKDSTQVRTILTLPVTRKPSSAEELLDNEASFDKETNDQIFWGVFLAIPSIPWGGNGELFIFNLHEKDGSNFQTRDREIYTPGFRLYRPAISGRFDYEWESMFQFGTVRSSTSPADTVDLDHLAFFTHVQAGYSFSAPWSPRIYLEYDYASGDNDPNDGSNEQFDRLFGANVPEFGPTHINTAFVRGNISSPGIRLLVKPKKNIYGYLSYRTYWLASDTDFWAGASGLRDPNGNSGNFLGHHFFVRANWKPHQNFLLEAGQTYRIDGEFQKNVSDSPRQGNSAYTYFQITFTF